VFEQLLPAPHNEIVLDLLFELAMWHGFAKLRLHTDTTLNDFDTAMTTLGQHLRTFAAKTCSMFVTKELPREEAARGRRKAAAAKKNSKGPQAAPGSVPVSTGAKMKVFNLFTYKLHALGDYMNTIRMFGTTDSYSTQVVCQSWLQCGLS
jgi:hypothetical protein